MDSKFHFYKNSFEYAKTLIKWVFFAVLIGILGGITGSLFHECIDYVSGLREEFSWLIYFLPIGGIIIAVLYSFAKKQGRVDTNRVLDSVSNDEKIPFIMYPLIFISSVITHLFGGSAGREGAALQLGGSLGYNIGSLFKLNNNQIHIMVMTGMSAVFAAVFGTPVTAAVFSLEVIAVGVMHYTALLPCILSAFIGQQISYFVFGIAPMSFNIEYVYLVPENIINICFIAVACAIISIVFCLAISKTELFAKKIIKNTYMRAFIAGAIIIILTYLVGTQEYNGAGTEIIKNAFNNNVRYEAFLLKIFFTAITVAGGFKGGEIVPAFFVGSTFGCVFGEFFGLSELGAAIGFIALFCGITNCPIASIFLGIEIFGAENLMVFAITCALSYIISGYCGLYKSQRILYSKIEDEYINTNAK